MYKEYYSYLFEDRKQFCDNICSFIDNRQRNTLEPVTISIDALWGYGKTYFQNALAERLEEKHCVLKYNAWKCDYETDVLISITNELVSQMRVEERVSKKLKRKVANALKSFFLVCSCNLYDKKVPSVVKAFNRSYISKYREIDKSNDIYGNFTDTASQILISKFQDILSYFRVNMKDVNKRDSYVVVLVDELDRCIPGYAIDILERFKHFFSAEGFIFIFMTNKNQIEKSIKHVFGDIDSSEYLQRFFDIDFKLPEPSYKEYLEMLYPSDKYGNDKSLILLKKWIMDMTENLSLRDIDRINRYISYLNSFKDNFTETQKAFASFIRVYQTLVKVGKIKGDYLNDDSWIHRNTSNEIFTYASSNTIFSDSDSLTNKLYFKVGNTSVPISEMFIYSESRDLLDVGQVAALNNNWDIPSHPRSYLLYFKDMELGLCSVDLSCITDYAYFVYILKVEGVEEVCKLYRDRLKWLSH